jgi:hypothetical protein
VPELNKLEIMSEDTHSKLDSERSMVAFREVCTKFRVLTRPTDSGRSSLYGGSLYGSAREQIRWFLRHPLRSYADFWKLVVTYPSNLNALDSRFPIDEMLPYLEQYSVEEIQSLKALTSLNLRTHKDRLTDNPILKISIPMGALYAVIKLGSEWAPQSTFSTAVVEYLKICLNNQFVSALFFGAIICLTIVAVQILFLSGPAIARAQLMDDLVLIVLESKKSKSQSSGIT